MGALLKFFFWIFIIFWGIYQVNKILMRFYFQKFMGQEPPKQNTFGFKPKKPKDDKGGDYVDYEVVK
ncbi:MAG: hypothetical protein SNJ77_12185 [Cytophagales bacterium]